VDPADGLDSKVIITGGADGKRLTRAQQAAAAAAAAAEKRAIAAANAKRAPAEGDDSEGEAVVSDFD